MRVTPGTPEVRVPHLVGLMAVDARESVRARGLFLHAPDRPEFHLALVDHVVRQYPRPGAEVPRASLVYVWFDLGEGEGGGGVREPRASGPPGGGLARELDEPRPPLLGDPLPPSGPALLAVSSP
ncbi:PASTA domain protein [Streptomyces sp. NPDC014603]|uniref:PASTA domain protein n=1 Tax=unclassified Streptomyces TaxID=2593676 RepID=UPI0036BD8947